MDEPQISIQVDATAKFQKKMKSLEKKYRNIIESTQQKIPALSRSNQEIIQEFNL